MHDIDQILGHTASYWLELDKRIALSDNFEARQMLQEIADLRGKISFYESRIKQMHALAIH